jgi:hypothetical protein
VCNKMAKQKKEKNTDPVQMKLNKTGLPDQLKTGIENLSGYSMDDVKVHYNLDKSAQFQAHAYAQGTDIHIEHGQEKHLPHEAWHVLQQKQGRVNPTMQMKGAVNVNDDDGLEKEADMMGEIQSYKTQSAIQRLSKISLYNNHGCLNAKHPFQLFGPSPNKGSHFIFGSSEWLNKSITEITVQIFWEKDIPSDFASYYAAYPHGFSNTSFKVAFSVLKDGVWKSLNNKSFRLFEENKVNIVSHLSTFILNLENNLIFAESEENSNKLEYNDKTREGFIKMQLVVPEYGFGHRLYSEIYAKTALEQAKWIKPNPFWGYLKFWKKRSISPLIPSLPYVPLVDKIGISITYLNPLKKEN